MPRLGRTRRYRFDLESAPLTAETLAAADAVLIVTDRSSIDYDAVVQHAPLIVDSRNATRRVTHGREKILRV